MDTEKDIDLSNRGGYENKEAVDIDIERNEDTKDVDTHVD